MKNKRLIMRKIKCLKKSDDAVAGIIVAVLIIGLILSILTVIQTIYVPDWMEQSEAEHMEEVSNQFAMLKYALDIQLTAEKENSPISTSICLGNKELPFFSSNKAFGLLEIQSDASIITIIDKDDFAESYPAGIITYSSDNSYYMNQKYIYENGAIIIDQQGKNVMSIEPVFEIDNTNAPTYDIVFKIVDIKSVGGKKSIGGYGTYPIRTDYSDLGEDPKVFSNIKKISITTDYQNSWRLFLLNKFISAGLSEDTDAITWPDDGDFVITTNNDEITVEINPVNTVNIEIIPKEITAQIARGWVE